MVCGGVYEYKDYRGVVMQGTMVAVEIATDGKKLGTLITHRHAPEFIIEGSERYDQLTLIGRPASPKLGRPRKQVA